MKKSTILVATAAILLSSCANEFNRVYKYADTDYRYEYAKQCFAKGKYSNAITLLQDVVTAEKGTENAQESLYPPPSRSIVHLIPKDFLPSKPPFTRANRFMSVHRSPVWTRHLL